MIRRPPRSTLFPYTPLSGPPLATPTPTAMKIGIADGVEHDVGALAIRSEEHTSELQSHLNLVCRLLLEKKKSRYFPASRDPRDRPIACPVQSVLPPQISLHS